MIRKLLTILSLFALMNINGFARAQETEPAGVDAPAGSSFTYQGQLKDADGPVTASCDFQLGLWDALTGGTQVGSLLTQTGVAVSEGLFTVQLDFGSGSFEGSARWLEIAVRCPAGSGTYNTLTPRQPLTPAPYALYSLSSANADTLDGLHASAFQQHYQNLVVVAKSGGDFSTITEALKSISTNSAANPFTIYVAPGVYTERVTMKPYVDIEGAGEQATKITYIGSSSIFTGTVVGADNAELRFLTVENTGGADDAVAIYNENASPRLTHVTAAASGGTNNRGVFNSSSSPTMTNVTATASGGSNSDGVYNQSSSSTMTNVTATASGGTENHGVSNDNTNNITSPTMTNVTANASGGTNNRGVWNNLSSPTMTSVTATASGGTNNQGVKNQYQSSPTMMNVTVTASGGGGSLGVANASSSSPTMINVKISATGATYNYGVWNDSSSPTMTGVTVTASGGTTSYGVYNANASSPTMTGVTATASGGTTNYGVYNTSSSSPTMTDVTATASEGANNYGVWNDSSSPTIQNSVISASGNTNDGLHNIATSGTYNIKINNSQISAGTSTIYQDSHYTTYVGASKVAGGGAFGGTYVCVGAYNGNYVLLDNTCH
jgi:hypothetical protein